MVRIKKKKRKKLKLPSVNWKEKYNQRKFIILLITIPIPFLLSSIAFFLNAKSTTVIAISSLGLVAVVLPYLIMNLLEFQELKRAEDGYPNFLRDLAQSVSAGMSIPTAIKTAAESKYGGLSKYIYKLHVWLSWSTPFPKAWEKFTNLLHKSELIKRVNGIILESFHSGGDVKVTLNLLADDVNLIKQMEAEKKSLLNQQIIVMYIVYMIFVGVVIGLFQILSPILFIQKLGMFSGISIKNSSEALSLEYFKNLFFLMILVESICAGVIAGQISEEKMVAGLKHVVVMMAVGVACFFIFIFPSTLSLETTIYPTASWPSESMSIIGQVHHESAPATGAQITIMAPDNQVYTLFVDSVGEFKKTITAPSRPGEYSLSISVEYKGEKTTKLKKFRVKSTGG